MNTTAPRILLVEDDPAVRDTVATALRGEGYEVRDVPDGLRIESVTSEFDPHLVILDVRLPVGPKGFSLARMLRTAGWDFPILFLTAAESVDDRLAGFDAGADDYLSKPFSVAELLARIRVLLRRSGGISSASWQVGDLIVDEDARSVVRDGREVTLTRTEFDLLVALGRNSGRVLTKTQLLANVWGFDEYDPNLVEVYISTLRRKLEAAGGSRLVHTVRGVGYLFRV